VTDWDSGVEDADERDAERRFREAGMRDKDELFGVLRVEWFRFEERLDSWARDIYADTGVAVPDSTRVRHRRNFHAMLQNRYGYSYVDPAWDSAHPLKDEFVPRHGSRGGRSNMSKTETLAACLAAKMALTGEDVSDRMRDVVP